MLFDDLSDTMMIKESIGKCSSTSLYLGRVDSYPAISHIFWQSSLLNKVPGTLIFKRRSISETAICRHLKDNGQLRLPDKFVLSLCKRHSRTIRVIPKKKL